MGVECVAPEGLRVGLYGLKPASQRLVRPIEDLLVARGVSPDAITGGALVTAAAGGACLALAGQVPGLLLVVPVLAALRLVLNILDGAVARRTGRSRPIGELWNELGDRAADVLFIGGLAFHPSVEPRLALGAVIAAILASYAGITARAAGGRRQYGGIMSKPGRMIVLAVAAPVAYVTGDGRALAGAAGLILIGSLVTLVQRIVTGRAELERAA
jgi:CDP-diacylglycerol--glycerol-3-phosphate 3-phosphatidyltransferase